MLTLEFKMHSTPPTDNPIKGILAEIGVPTYLTSLIENYPLKELSDIRCIEPRRKRFLREIIQGSALSPLGR